MAPIWPARKIKDIGIRREGNNKKVYNRMDSTNSKVDFTQVNIDNTRLKNTVFTAVEYPFRTWDSLYVPADLAQEQIDKVQSGYSQISGPP